MKLALAYTSVIAAVLILLNTYPLLMTQDMIFQSKQDTMQGQSLVVSNTLSVGERLTADGVEQAISLLEDLRYSRIMVTDEGGLVIYDSGEESIVGQYALVEGVVSALHGNDVFHCEYKNGVFRSFCASPVITRGSVVGAVYLYESDESQGMLLKEIQQNLQMISLVICILVLLISGTLSGTITKRFGMLLQGMRTVREGEYAHRVTMKGQDELSQLAEEFNELTGRLQVTEEARRRFVSDASHELKTPLASIKLMTDSILSGDMNGETTREFVTDISEAADRLTRISEDLLTLNRLDAGQKRKSEPVDAGQAVKQTGHILQPLAQRADVTVQLDLEPDCFIWAHEGEFGQIVSNLLENAIKYNLPRGQVFVGLHKLNGQVELTVEDTGVGIPEEDLPHIFQRFYRVDKARSRDAGGTGLGLSIVWETVRLHGGEIFLSAREEGTGLRVAVRFPEWREGEGL